MAKYSYHEPVGNPCVKCGLTRARHRVRHPPGCKCGASHKGGRSPSDAKRTRKARAYIVGLDGEGMRRDPHRYTLLAWSNESGERTSFVEDLGGLSTARCLRFLTDIPADAKPFGYYLGYDWTKILADLPNKSLYKLFRPALRALPKDEGEGFSNVCWREYELHWLGGMMRVRRNRGRWITIWDVGKFFQTRFDNALADAGIESGNIPEMKEARSGFTESDSERIREYCLLECRQLAQLVRTLNEAHEQANLPLTSWHSPGSAASVLLKQMNIGELRGTLPRGMLEPVAKAFFGGRFEHSAFGVVRAKPRSRWYKHIYGADVVSAYPAECLDLPCLHHARWRRSSNPRDLEHAEQACVEYELCPTDSPKRAWGPLPIRMSDGTITFPRSGARGWTWLKEWRVARRWPEARFVSAWILSRNCSCVPFEGIKHAFDTRLAVGKKSAVGGALKRAINSCYGKLAQSVGDPPFRSQVWAGMITSGCRAKLLEVIWELDADVLAVATDGVYTRKRPTVDEGAYLGDWELDTYSEITLVRPGIYWTDSDVRSRGLPRKVVAEQQSVILEAIEAGALECILPPLTQFGGVTAGVYATRKGLKRSARYGEWFERPARIGFSPAPKRDADWQPFEFPRVIESAPYTGVASAEAERAKFAAMLAEYDY